MKNLKKKYLELYLKHGFYFRNADIGPTWTQHLKIQQFKNIWNMVSIFETPILAQRGPNT